ncbi:MAG TPA: DUF2127 domain-containing protein [Polyangiales bacterium]
MRAPLSPPPGQTNMRTCHRNVTGLQLIVAYKASKAVIEVLFGVLLLSIGTVSFTHEVRGFALSLQHHATAAWTLALAERLVRAATERNLLVVAVASLVDGVFSGFESWALHRRYGFSHWLVICATASLVPFEAVALVRHVSAVRVALLLLNVWIVGYLVRGKLAGTPNAS